MIVLKYWNYVYCGQIQKFFKYINLFKKFIYLSKKTYPSTFETRSMFLHNFFYLPKQSYLNGKLKLIGSVIAKKKLSLNVSRDWKFKNLFLKKFLIDKSIIKRSSKTMINYLVIFFKFFKVKKKSELQRFINIIPYFIKSKLQFRIKPKFFKRPKNLFKWELSKPYLFLNNRVSYNQKSLTEKLLHTFYYRDKVVNLSLSFQPELCKITQNKPLLHVKIRKNFPQNFKKQYLPKKNFPRVTLLKFYHHKLIFTSSPAVLKTNILRYPNLTNGNVKYLKLGQINLPFIKPNTFTKIFSAISILRKKKIFFTKNLNILNLNPKTSKLFIFRNIGIFINNQTLFFAKKYFKFKFKFKKLIFSFIFPNQIRRNLISKRKRLMLSKFFSRKKFFISKSKRFSYKLLKKKFKNYYSYYLKNITSNQYNNLNLFSNNNNPNLFPNNKFFAKSTYDIQYNENFKSKGYNFSFKKREVHISRVKFKPGYQRIWRQARSALKEAMNLKFKYQYRLTKYLTNFFRITTSHIFSISEMTLSKTILYSQLLPDLLTINMFFENGWIFLNGKKFNHGQSLLITGDTIQLIVSQWYYIFYRWLTNWTTKRIKKFRRLVYRKGLASKYKLMKTRKQRSRYTPMWIHNTRFDGLDIKSYLEVDYFSLSAVVLYEPHLTTHFIADDLPYLRSNIYRLYNWKYIT